MPVHEFKDSFFVDFFSFVFQHFFVYTYPSIRFYQFFVGCMCVVAQTPHAKSTINSEHLSLAYMYLDDLKHVICIR